MFDNSFGDFITKFAPLIGWTALIGIAWRLRGVVEEQVTLWKRIDAQTKEAVHEVATVKEKVDTLQTNHMAHMQGALEGIGRSNDKSVELLQDIKAGIGILTDRGTRDLVVETKIRHVDPISPVKPEDDKEL